MIIKVHLNLKVQLSTRFNPSGGIRRLTHIWVPELRVIVRWLVYYNYPMRTFVSSHILFVIVYC